MMYDEIQDRSYVLSITGFESRVLVDKKTTVVIRILVIPKVDVGVGRSCWRSLVTGLIHGKYEMGPNTHRHHVHSESSVNERRFPGASLRLRVASVYVAVAERCIESPSPVRES